MAETLDAMSIRQPTRSLSGIPEDVIDYILDFLSPRTLPRVCLLNRNIGFLAQKALYRDLFMSSPNRMLKCCETLLSNPTTTTMVRTVSVRFSYNTKTQSKLFYEVVEAAFLSLPDVMALEILVSTPEFVRVLAKCRWPRLHRFQSFLPTLPELLQFMGHHPTLRTTFFSWDYADLSTLPRIHLPNMKKFIGPGPLIPLVVPGSQAGAVQIVSRSSTAQLEAALIAMQDSTEAITTFSMLIEDWDFDHLRLVSAHLPHLVDLNIRNSWTSPEKSSSHMIFLRTIGPLLKDFPNLQNLTLNSEDKDHDDLSLFLSLLDIEAVIAGGFGLSCPTLSTCTMPSDVTWFKLQSCVWIPQNNRPKGRAWMRYVLDTGIHPVVKNLDDETAELIMTSIRNVLETNPEWYGEVEDEASDHESDGGYGYKLSEGGVDEEDENDWDIREEEEQEEQEEQE
ncbi:hypothetical protein NEOLEDRAFT_1173024 [Neolentinus lepideus HHB14362 ss-1]|uniref:F-box domain-containing protein n=1 Tax=Neolentinus lepideus HHB14362 ss-1 TaxID=1314782 RepID=A0A165NCE0_9AGAM|nr:hypothetical protein NEOLEDRAFT_1173024 [Neolentinus lepideus HHB14362 ss-1]